MSSASSSYSDARLSKKRTREEYEYQKSTEYDCGSTEYYLLNSEIKEWIDLCYKERDKNGYIGDLYIDSVRTDFRSVDPQPVFNCPSASCQSAYTLTPYVQARLRSGLPGKTRMYLDITIERVAGPGMKQFIGMTKIDVCHHVRSELEDYVKEQNQLHYNDPNTEADELLKRTYQILLRDYFGPVKHMSNDLLSIICSYLLLQ